MVSRKSAVFYLLSVAVLLILSAYPLINGARMAHISITNGVLEPDDYARYVIPYAAICVSLIIYALFEPLFSRLKKAAFPVGFGVAILVFLAVEIFFENMQIHVTGMALIDTSTLTTTAGQAGMTADLWQSALCAVSPAMMGQSMAYTSTEGLIYVVENGAYKIHYYMISFIMIAMVSALIYGIAKMHRTGDVSLKKPLNMRAIAVTALVAMCIFANSTAFFREAAPVQTPLASFLTGLFFVVLGVSAGMYSGSYLLGKEKRTGVGVPALLAVLATVLMYIGEAMMMGGNLYRFGTGWFHRGIPVILLSAADILIIFMSGAVTYVTVGIARRRSRWPGPRTLSVVIVLSILTGLAGPVLAMTAPEKVDDKITGCYVFARNIYTHALGSYMPAGDMPYVFGFDDDVYYHAGKGTIGIKTFDIEYYKAPVAADEFEAQLGAAPGTLHASPDMAAYNERYLLAVMTDKDSGSLAYALYGMDGEYWLVSFSEFTGVQSIYEVVKTEATTLDDLRRAAAFYAENTPVPLNMPLYTMADGMRLFYENQMTLKDVYALARKGWDLTLEDFNKFCYWLTGDDFTVRLYEVAGAYTLFVYSRDDALAAALFLSRQAIDDSQTIDLRRGLAAFAEYMNPFNRFMEIRIAQPSQPVQEPELIFEDDYFGSECRYYLDASRGSADEQWVTVFHGEQMTATQALQKRYLSIEDLVANGFTGLIMVPIDNPLGGRFTNISALQTFLLNDEVFYPSKSFMYAVFGEQAEGDAAAAVTSDGMAAYFDITELAVILDLYGYDEKAEFVREFIDWYEDNALSVAETGNGEQPGTGEEIIDEKFVISGEIHKIARGIYADSEALLGLGFEIDILWPGNPNTPVWIKF